MPMPPAVRCAVCDMLSCSMPPTSSLTARMEVTLSSPTAMALCKIHHAAYDRNFLGISPKLVVHINQRLLDEVDGPMLKHGLQEMHGATIAVPRSQTAKPDPERLEHRYTRFLEAS